MIVLRLEMSPCCRSVDENGILVSCIVAGFQLGGAQRLPGGVIEAGAGKALDHYLILLLSLGVEYASDAGPARSRNRGCI